MLLRLFALTSLLFAVAGCGQATPTLEQRKEKIRSIETHATDTALTR